MLRRVYEFLEAGAGWLISAGQLSFFLMLMFLFLPRYFFMVFEYLEINQFVVLFVLFALMFLSSPLLLFSGAVGLSRRKERRGGERALGTVFAVLLFAQGFVNAVAPVAVVFWLGLTQAFD